MNITPLGSAAAKDCYLPWTVGFPNRAYVLPPISMSYPLVTVNSDKNAKQFVFNRDTHLKLSLSTGNRVKSVVSKITFHFLNLS
jgi:hypothetical protein